MSWGPLGWAFGKTSGAVGGTLKGWGDGLGWGLSKLGGPTKYLADSGGYFLHSWGGALGKVYGMVDPRLGAAVGGSVSGGGTLLQGGGAMADGMGKLGALGWKGVLGIAGLAVLAAGVIGGLVGRIGRAASPSRMTRRTVSRAGGLFGIGGRHRSTTVVQTTSVQQGGRRGLGVVGVVIVVLVTMVATGQTTWTQLAHGAPQALGNVLPSACTATTTAPVPVPTGIVATGYRIGHGIGEASRWDTSREHVDAVVKATADLLGQAWHALLDGIDQGAGTTAAPPATPTDPRLQVDYPSASSSPDVIAARAALAAGFPDPVRAVAVAGAETGWRSVASPPNRDGSIDYGYWQVNSVHADLLARYDWHDPQQNALAALAVFTDRAGSGRDGWTAWTTYVDGASDAFMAQAAQAVAVARGQLGPYPVLAEPAADPRVQPCASTAVPVSAPTGSVAARVIAFALAQVGKPYIYGAAPMPTPTGPVPASFDCSSLVDSAFLAAGVDLPGRQTTGTLVRLGVPVTADALQPGDVVLPTSGHTGIYLGGGKYVDAPHTGAVVRVDTLPLPLFAARRLGAAQAA